MRLRVTLPLPEVVVRGLRLAALALAVLMLLELLLAPPSSGLEAALSALAVAVLSLAALIVRPHLTIDHDPAP